MDVKFLNNKGAFKLVSASLISFLLPILFNIPVNAEQKVNGYYLVVYNITTGKNERLDYSNLEKCKKHEAGFSRVGNLVKRCTAF